MLDFLKAKGIRTTLHHDFPKPKGVYTASSFGRSIFQNRRRTDAPLLETGWRLYDTRSQRRKNARHFETRQRPNNTTTGGRTSAWLGIATYCRTYRRHSVTSNETSVHRRNVVLYGRLRVSESQALVRPRVIVLYGRRLVSTDARLFKIRRRPYDTMVRRRTDASLLKARWRLYDRSGSRRKVVQTPCSFEY